MSVVCFKDTRAVSRRRTENEFYIGTNVFRRLVRTCIFLQINWHGNKSTENVPSNLRPILSLPLVTKRVFICTNWCHVLNVFTWEKNNMLLRYENI